MENIAFLIHESHMSFNEVMELPYAVFLSLLKHFQMFELMKTEEGREMLKNNKILSQTEPDWDRIRSLPGYRKEVK